MLKTKSGHLCLYMYMKLLEENDQLIRCIVEYQSKGRATDCVQYQHILHRNLIYLATIADATPPSSQKTVD
uniref:SS18 like 2 n=1 Tax=Otus sunia TaxID=257818 RepID=A0A8C8A9B7_9STRI